MPENFRSLAAMLTAGAEPSDDAASVEIVEELRDLPPADDHARELQNEELARDVRLFHVRLAEAVDAAVGTLLADIAAEVVARELELAPADVAAIVDRALERYRCEDPLRVRVHPDDAEALRSCELLVIADTGLRRGDLVLELRDGTIDAMLGTRLQTILRNAVAA